ncbi:hypothetical protein TNCV_3400151 [Trichonephila clavipes]|nr:hypothetical protein TNCV_3400151 [Trichonephila clavipes]
MREMWPRHEGCSGYIQKIGRLNPSLRKFSMPQRSSFAQIHKELGIYSQAVADWRSYASDVLIEHIVVNTKKLGGRSLVYADKPQTIDHLEDNIRRVIADIRPQMLKKVIENWTSRLDYIRASLGSHARNHI